MKMKNDAFDDNSHDHPGYKTVKIGDQLWMAKNLTVSQFRNGDKIPEARINNNWEMAGIEGSSVWCYYDNEPGNGKKYGKLYNWYAVMDPRKLAPEGWHIPDDDEWIQLISYLGGINAAGIKMRSATGWENHIKYSGESLFAGLPGGYRNDKGVFSFLGRWGIWWSSTEFMPNLFLAWSRLLNYDGKISASSSYKRSGLSVRCLRD